MPEYNGPEPVVQITGAAEIARDLMVIPSRQVQLVPNIGVIGGTHSVLVIATGMGPRNAGKVLAFAAGYARGRRMYLTTTHFHPEHAFGAQVFAGQATYLVNRAQAEDLAAKGPGYLAMFRGPGEPVARQLDGTELAAPDLVYDEAYDLDPGGRVVRLRAAGRAHSRGDQVVTVPDAGVMFTGDLVEAAQAAAVRHPRTQLTSASRPCDTKGKPLRPRGSRRRPGHTGQRTAPPARTETDMKLKNGRDYET